MMGPGYLASPVAFLIDTVFGLYIMAVMLRFLLQWREPIFITHWRNFLFASPSHCSVHSGD